MLLKDGAHWVTISITLLELWNILLAVCMNKMTLQVKHNLNDLGKCCGPTAQKLSKQIPIQDILFYGSAADMLKQCIYMSIFVITRASIDQGIAHPLEIRTPDWISVDFSAS